MSRNVCFPQCCLALLACMFVSGQSMGDSFAGVSGFRVEIQRVESTYCRVEGDDPFSLLRLEPILRYSNLGSDELVLEGELDTLARIRVSKSLEDLRKRRYTEEIVPLVLSSSDRPQSVHRIGPRSYIDVQVSKPISIGVWLGRPELQAKGSLISGNYVVQVEIYLAVKSQSMKLTSNGERKSGLVPSEPFFLRIEKAPQQKDCP